ncbi:gamma carbonic anhydrase family protein [Pseudomonas sp. PA15(2017)]|uniref:gamma carbonic anhydrase family protein n=1 Tax=Pseudomonas sp. PA15(2017) TaxID=1932111 RepID=UPI0009651539|nr:gamma carbonic anhydrase family protein [Pseudomonas sp. PA15(2017)]OLU35264.1 gamma carbonic anhydrase family protein [Pseudomonas sp. PA15(2017)]
MAIRTYQGTKPTLGDRVFVDSSAVVIGDVEIGEDSSVWPLTVIRGDMHRIRIGKRTSVQDGSVLHITHAGPFNPDGFPLIIGNEVTIGHKVMLHGCTLGSRILVGMGSTVMDGAVVEDDVIIGAGSLVPPGKVLESGFLYVGSPVKQARPLTDKERHFFSYTAGNYVRLKDQHIAEGYDQSPTAERASTNAKV